MRYFIGRRPIKRAITAVFPLAGLKYVEVHRGYDYWTKLVNLSLKNAVNCTFNYRFLVKSPSLNLFYSDKISRSAL